MTTILDNAVSREVAKIVLKAKYPNLIMVSGDSYRENLTTAAKNVRAELKATFPGVKFSVRTSRFSGGDSIDVDWIDGPTTKMVEAIIKKYKAGNFDGMTDCYEYSVSDWNRAFGDAKYVSANRTYSDNFVESAIDITSRKFGVTPIAVAAYRKGEAWKWGTNNGFYLGDELNATLSKLCRAMP